MQSLSTRGQAFDTSPVGMRRAAGDLGEVLALMAGGMRPDAETVARLNGSMRQLQGWLASEAGRAEVDLARGVA